MNEKPDIECTVSPHKRIKQYIAQNALLYGEDTKPIYEILVFEHPDKERVYDNCNHSGFPDMGAQSNVGFYYDLQDALDVVYENLCDIRETVYNAAFIICRFPGLYNCVGSDGRLYFVWDETKDGYRLTKEPEIFEHMAL